MNILCFQIHELQWLITIVLRIREHERFE